MKEEKGFLSNFKKIGGMDLWMYVVCAILIGATVATGSMSNDLMAYIAICLSVSLLLHRIGKVLPIWNTYIGGACYGVGRLFSKVLLPTVLGAQIHSFAYTILVVVIIAALGIVPKNIRVTAKKIQEFMTTVVAMMTMVGLGFDFNLGELVSACSPSNIAIAFCVVIGAIIGSALVGKLVGFYPIDSAVTAGLCMANRGGAGDIAVLTAADRMGLISYAQLSSRIGGGIVLIIASFAFSILLK